MVFKYLFQVSEKKKSEILTPIEGIFDTGKEIVLVSHDDFRFFEQTEIKNSLASSQFIQDSYFLYKRNLVEKIF